MHESVVVVRECCASLVRASVNVDTRAESREQETLAHIVEMGASLALASLLCNRNVRVSLYAIYQTFVC